MSKLSTSSYVCDSFSLGLQQNEDSLRNFLSFNENAPLSSLIIQETESTEFNPLEKYKFSPSEHAENSQLSGLWKNHLKGPSVWKVGYEKLSLPEEYITPVLDDKLMSLSCSCIKQVPVICKYAYTKVNLREKQLEDVNLLKYYHYLQYVDVSHNQISDLKCLGQLPFLMYLDASHNNLEVLLDFKAPQFLTYVNYSFNKLKSMEDISKFWSIKELDLSHNHIRLISGILSLHYLQKLNLSYNEISVIENLTKMQLVELDLSHNQIHDFRYGDGLELGSLSQIRIINVSNNSLNTLKLFKGVENIEMIDASFNNIENLLELYYLENLRYLYQLKLTGNAVVKNKNYLSVCLAAARRLCVLDGDPLDAQKKIATQVKQDKSFEKIAGEHAHHLVLLEQLNVPLIDDTVFPWGGIRPTFIIFVCLPGGGTTKLMRKFLIEHQKYVTKAISHTTREKDEQEEDGKEYFFITKDQYRTKLAAGEFISSAEFFGNCFGLSREQLVKAENNILVTSMDINSALSMSFRGFYPRLVLSIPKTEETYLAMLKSKYHFFPDEEEKLVIKRAPTGTRDSANFSRTLIHKFAENTTKSILQELLNRVELETHSGPSYSYSEEHRIAGGILKKEGKRHSGDNRGSITFEDTIERDEDTNEGIILPKRIVSFSTSEIDNSSLKNYRSISKDPIVSNYNPVLSVVSDEDIRTLPPKKGNAFFFDDSDRLKNSTQFFFEDLLRRRNELLDFHWSAPGTFRELIFTDEPQESLIKLTGMLKSMLENPKVHHDPISLRNDPSYNNITKARLMSYEKDFEEEMSISKKQNVRCIPKQFDIVKESHDDLCLKKNLN